MKKIVLIISLLMFVCVGCQANNSNINKNTIEKKREAAPYLSITESLYLDKREETMASRVFTYDTVNRNMKEVGQVPYTSQYPLTMYDFSNKTIYYSAYSGKGDQIYSSEKNCQLTSNLCAVNYISKCGNKKFVIATYLKCNALEPLLYDEKIQKYQQIVEDKNDDLDAWAVAIDYENHNIYFSAFSDKEDRETMDIGKAPKSTIYCYNVDSDSTKEVYVTNQYIIGMAVKDKILYMTTSKDGVEDKKHNKLYQINLEDGKKQLIQIDAMIIGNMEIVQDEMYFLGFVDNKRGIYSVNLDNNHISNILIQNKKEYINGFSLNY